MRKATTIWVQNFKGLNDEVSPGRGQSPRAANEGLPPPLTPDLRNVKFENGQVVGRGGLTKYLSIATVSATTPILGLFDYRKASGTNLLLRMTPTALHVLNTGTVAWDTVTGTALTGVGTTTRPQYTIIDDTLVFTNEGEDLPRKYTGSGNSADIASSTSPYAKSIEAYVGYLMLGNVSDSGAFTDVTDGHRIIRYSDDWDTNWTLCDGNELTLDETPGAIQAMKVLGRDLICYKDDGIVKVTWTGQQQRFRQELMPSSVGCIAPLSVGSCDGMTHIYLGQDAALYMVSPNGIKALSSEHLNQTLPPTFSLAKLKFARAMVDQEEGTYYLFYDRTGLAGQALDSYVSYNYRTGEFSKGRVGASVYSVTSHRPTAQSELDLVLGFNDLVKEFDSGADDDGVYTDRYITTNWYGLGEEGIFSGARLVLKKSSRGRVKVSVARDFEQDFTNEQTFNLKGQLASDENVELAYRVPHLYGDWFNLKIRFYHDSSTATTALRRIGMEVQPMHPVASTVRRASSNTKG
jgi:hypothetical protein